MRTGLVCLLVMCAVSICAQRHPSAMCTPMSFDIELPADEVCCDTIWLVNTGADTLHANVSDLAPGERSGGPDAFGYQWVDSDDPEGPTYEWFDISETGVALSLYDDDDMQAPLPFPFTFYGVSRYMVRINSNGYLSFGWSGSELENTSIPAPGFPNSLICAFWDDLKPIGWDNGYDWGTVYYQADYANDRFIVQYENVSHFHLNTPVNPETFQIILNMDGTILLQYKTLSQTSFCTVGVENDDGTDGLQVVHNDFYLHNDMAVWIGVPPVPDWLSATPDATIVPPGQSVPLHIEIDTTDMDEGEYTRYVRVESNDPANGQIDVTVQLHVATPVFGPVPDQLDFGQTPVYEDEALDFQVENIGAGVLCGVLHCPQPFWLETTAGRADSVTFSLAAGEALTAPVHFVPQDAASYSDQLLAVLDNGEQHTVPLNGEGYWNPQIDLVPPDYAFTISPNSDTLSWLQVGNSGSGVLEYNVLITYPMNRDNTRDSLTVLNSTFDEGIPSSWTVVDGGNSTDTWHGANSYNSQSIDGTPFAFVDSDAASSHQLDEQLVSPAFNVTGAQGLFLEFDHFFYEYDQGGDEVADVDVWNGVSWQNVYRRTSSEGSWSNPQHVVLNLLDHVNGELRVRFHYYNAQWDWYWAVDNVKIWGYCDCTYHWITINDGTSWSDSIAMGDQPQDLLLRFNSLGLNPGEYYAELQFLCNDPHTPVTVLPITMTVSSDNARPENIAIEVEDDIVILSWDEVAGAAVYCVYAADNPEGPWGVAYEGPMSIVNGRAVWSEPASGSRGYYRVTAIYSYYGGGTDDQTVKAAPGER